MATVSLMLQDSTPEPHLLSGQRHAALNALNALRQGQQQHHRRLSELPAAPPPPASPLAPPATPPLPPPPISPPRSPPPSRPYFDWDTLGAAGPLAPPLVQYRPVWIAALTLSVVSVFLLLGCCVCWEVCFAAARRRRRSAKRDSPSTAPRLSADPFPPSDPLAAPGGLEMYTAVYPKKTSVAFGEGGAARASDGRSADGPSDRGSVSWSTPAAERRAGSALAVPRPSSRGSRGSAPAPLPLQRQIERHLDTASLDLEAVEATVNGYATQAQQARVDAQRTSEEKLSAPRALTEADWGPPPVYEVEPLEARFVLSCSSEPAVCSWCVAMVLALCVFVASATLLGLSFLPYDEA